MPTWNELFLEEQNIERVAEPEVYRFAAVLEKLFSERPLRIWDVGCGAGRHTIALARFGHQVYASDNAPNAINRTREWLASLNLPAQTALAEMTVCPWPQVTFHGGLSWDALHHNTLDNIRSAIAGIHHRLVPGGLFMATLISTKADTYGEGEEIEPDTFIRAGWEEAGIPHHFFDEQGIRDLFKQWAPVSLAERVVTYIERGENFVDDNPFPYTKWCILVRKRARNR